MKVAALALLLGLCLAVSASDVKVFPGLRGLRNSLNALSDDHDLTRHGPEIDSQRVGVLHPNYAYYRFQEVGVEGVSDYLPAAKPIQELLEKKLGITSAQHDNLKQLEGELSTVALADARLYVALLQKIRVTCDQAAAGKGTALMYPLLALLNAQNAGDPFYFVSHSATHGIRVAEAGLPLLQAGMLDAMKAAYGGSADKAECATLITLVLHDIGYGPGFMGKGFNKFLHAENGKWMIMHYTAAADAIKAIFGADGAKVLEAITDSIATHNYDTRDSKTHQPDNGGAKGKFAMKWDAGLAKGESKAPSDNDGNVAPDDAKCLIDGQQILAIASEGDQRYTRTFTEGQVQAGTTAALMGKNGPLQVAVRYADQIDAQRRRLTPYQQGVEFMTVLAKMYAARVVKDAAAAWKTTNVYDLTSNKAGSLPEIAKFDGSNSAKDASIPKEISKAKYFDSSSFMHYFSNWAVKSCQVASAGDDLEMTVTLFDGADTLPKTKTYFIALYQIVRAADAMWSLKWSDGKRLTDKIKVTVKEGTATVANFDKVPLRVFNPNSWDRETAGQCDKDKTQFKTMFDFDEACDSGKGCLNEKILDVDVKTSKDLKDLPSTASLECPAGSGGPAQCTGKNCKKFFLEVSSSVGATSFLEMASHAALTAEQRAYAACCDESFAQQVEAQLRMN